jgi:hypothetical protein
MLRKDYYGILGVAREAEESGVNNGTLFTFKRALSDGQEIELQFRVSFIE